MTSHRSDELIFHGPEHPCERGRNLQGDRFLWKFERTLRPILDVVKILSATARYLQTSCAQRDAPRQFRRIGTGGALLPGRFGYYKGM